MHARCCGFRPFAATIFAAMLISMAGPAATAETAYLMYVRGSEGPPATPTRVLWHELDEANGRITIDFGTKYEGFLSKLGLATVLAYDARREKAQFVVRNPDFAQFVKVVATSIVRGLPKAVAGAWVQPVEAEVQDATLAITQTPDHGRLEVTTWLHVTYRELQKSGPPKLKTLVKGDLVFVGQPEPAASR